MSESAEDRTKRRFSNYIDMAEWKYQYSFFHNDLEVAKTYALQDGATLRKQLARRHKNQPFLYRLCLTLRGYKGGEETDEDTGEIIRHPVEKVLLPFHMFLTTEKLPKGALDTVMGCCMDGELVCRYRRKSGTQIEVYKSAVMHQKPHNLKRFFGDRKINRIALLNAKSIS